MINIKADMIIINAIWKKILSQIVKLAWNKQIKKNWKKWLIRQAESDNENDFQNIKIEKLKYQKFLIFLNHFFCLKIDSMFYHVNLSYYLD